MNNDLKWLIAVTEPLRVDHPDALMAELIELLLDEPDRSRARVIYQALAPTEGLFLERVNRKPWHRGVEVAISLRIRESEFNLNDILAEAGVAPDAVERPEAESYACRMVEALAHCPAQPVIKRTDRLQ